MMERFSGGFELNVSKVCNLIKVFLKNSFKDFDFLKIAGTFSKEKPTLKCITKKMKIRR
jgi:hypothetical protein